LEVIHVAKKQEGLRWQRDGEILPNHFFSFSPPLLPSPFLRAEWGSDLRVRKTGFPVRRTRIKWYSASFFPLLRLALLPRTLSRRLRRDILRSSSRKLPFFSPTQCTHVCASGRPWTAAAAFFPPSFPFSPSSPTVAAE